MTWLYIWLGVVAVTLVVEFITLDLVSIWISLGAFVAMILAGCGVRYEIQIAVAIVVSVATLLGLRKITMKFLMKSKEKTNMDLVIGTKAKLLSDITEDDMGTIKINGIVYSAKTEKGEEIKAGEHVEIVKMEGNKFIVKKEKK